MPDAPGDEMREQFIARIKKTAAELPTLPDDGYNWLDTTSTAERAVADILKTMPPRPAEDAPTATWVDYQSGCVDFVENLRAAFSVPAGQK